MIVWKQIDIIARNLEYPTGICFNKESNILYIANMRGNRVDWVNTKSFESGSLSSEIIGLENHPFIKQPMAVCIDHFQNVLMADAGMNMIFGYDFIKQGWIAKIDCENTLKFPAGVTVNQENEIYVNDFFNNCIKKIDRNKSLITITGGTDKRGYLDGTFEQTQIDNPYGVFWNQDVLYFVDKVNNVIRYCDFQNEVVNTLKMNNEILKFDNPVAMDMDVKGNIGICEKERLYYVDFINNERYLLLDNKLWQDIKSEFGIEGEIGYISGIAFNKEGEIYWADANHGFIYYGKFEIDS